MKWLGNFGRSSWAACQNDLEYGYPKIFGIPLSTTQSWSWYHHNIILQIKPLLHATFGFDRKTASSNPISCHRVPYNKSLSLVTAMYGNSKPSLNNLPSLLDAKFIINCWLHYLVGGFNPSEKYQSIWMMTFPTEWENKIHVPNHQPAYISFYEHHILEDQPTWNLVKRPPGLPGLSKRPQQTVSPLNLFHGCLRHLSDLGSMYPLVMTNIAMENPL